MLLDSGQALDELAKTCVGIERVHAKVLLDSGQALDELAKTCVDIERVHAKMLHSGVMVVGGKGDGKITRIRGEDSRVEEQESKDC